MNRFNSLLIILILSVLSFTAIAGGGGGGGGGGGTGSSVPFLHPLLNVLIFIVITFLYKKQK